MRKDFAGYLESQSIETRAIMCGTLPDQPGLAKAPGRSVGNLRNSRYIRDNAFSIGCHPLLGREELDHVIKTIKITLKMSTKHILVTGGTGAIGSNLVRRLIELNEFEKLVILDNNSSGHADNAVAHDKVEYVYGDICDEAVLDSVFAHDITHVYHLVANFANQLSVDFPVKDLTTNGVGIVKLLERSTKHGVEKFLYSSSSCVYKPTGQPFSETSPLMLSTPYAITKLLSEHYVTFYNKFRGLPAVVVRYFSSYGPGDYPGKFRSVIPNFYGVQCMVNR